MAFLFADGFDSYGSTGDLTTRWDSYTNNATLALAGGTDTPFGTGQALTISVKNINTNVVIAKGFGSNEGTVFLSFRRKLASGGPSAPGLVIGLRDNSSNQVSVVWREDGSITAHNGSSFGTTLGTAPSGTAPSGAWESWQVKVVIHNTAGSVEVRRNGGATPVLKLENVNTRGGTANAYANTLVITNTSNQVLGATSLDDLFVCSGSGAAPNDWPGDLRGAAAAPNAAVQAQFTASTGTNLGCVDDTTQNGDTDYIYSSTSGQEDLYAFPTLAAQGLSPTAIAGIIPFAVVRKSDSGARALSVRAKSGTTDAGVVADSAIPLSYAWRGGFLATDPATGAAWMTGGVNALQVGVKVDA